MDYDLMIETLEALTEMSKNPAAKHRGEEVPRKKPKVPGYGTLAAILGITRNAAKKRIESLTQSGLVDERPFVPLPPWSVTEAGVRWLKTHRKVTDDPRKTKRAKKKQRG